MKQRRVRLRQGRMLSLYHRPLNGDRPPRRGFWLEKIKILSALVPISGSNPLDFLKKKNFFRLAMFNPNRVIVWAKGSCFVAWARNPAP